MWHRLTLIVHKMAVKGTVLWPSGYQTTQCHILVISEDGILHSHHRENLKSYLLTIVHIKKIVTQSLCIGLW
jgi:hypothetical protein